MKRARLLKLAACLSLCVGLMPASSVLAAKPATYMHAGTASWYRYKNCRCAASPDFPRGTYVLVSRADNPKRSVVVRINDFGPVRSRFPTRAIDLDLVAFQAIGNKRDGLMKVVVEPLDPSDPRVKAAKAAELHS